jgi:Ca2+ transporting ATPase
MCIGSCVNSDANPRFDHNGKFEQIGNKTECALLEMALKFGYDYVKIRNKEQVPLESKLDQRNHSFQL